MITEDDLRSLASELAPRIARDPRVPATICLGTIGHRVIEQAVRERLVRTVTEVLNLIRESAEAALKQQHIREQFTDGLDLILISPLAEGADRLIARAGLQQGYKLGVILPFAPAEYEKTFDLDDPTMTIEEFHKLLDAAALPHGYGILALDGDSEPHRRDNSFRNCAKAVTSWSDILIAILSNERRDSQTGLSVQSALDGGVPIVAIDPARPDSFTLLVERERGASSGQRERLSNLVASFLAPSQEHQIAQKHPARRKVRSKLDAYRGERVHCDLNLPCDLEYAGPYTAKTGAPAWVRSCSGLNRWVEAWVHRLLAEDPNEIAHEAEQAKLTLRNLLKDKATAAPVIELFLRYQRADAIANAYAELYRSILIVVVLLGVAAVTFGAFSAVGSSPSPLLAGLEFASVALALSFVWIAHKQAWLDRWLDYRLLAEIFRYSKFLLLTGRSSPFALHHRPHPRQEDERLWTRDHAQYVLRAHRLAMPGRGREAEEGTVRLIANYILARCVDDQVRYHCRTANFRLKFVELLRTMSIAVSVITLAVIGAKFALEFLLALHIFASTPAIEPWRQMGEVADVILPAITAAFLALRAYGEHDVVSKRSLAMACALEHERSLIEKTRSIEDLGTNMVRIARLLLREIDGWLELFAGKHLE